MRQSPRAPQVGRLLVLGRVKNTGSSHATSGFAKDGEPWLAAMQDSIALQVFPAPSMGRTHAFDGWPGVRHMCRTGVQGSNACVGRVAMGATYISHGRTRMYAPGLSAARTTTRSVGERLQGRDACVARVTRDGHPGLACSTESEAQCPEHERGVRRGAPNTAQLNRNPGLARSTQCAAQWIYRVPENKCRFTLDQIRHRFVGHGVYDNAQTIKATRRIVREWAHIVRTCARKVIHRERWCGVQATKRFETMNSKISRRALVRGGLITGALIPVAGLFINRLAIAAPAVLDPSDPTAKALGYVQKSAKPGQQCDNCSLYQGKSGDSQGPCTVFPGKTVASGGWCMTWAKKPG